MLAAGPALLVLVQAAGPTAPAGVHLQRRVYRLHERVHTARSCAIVVTQRSWTACDQRRVFFTVQTAPQMCQVVVLYDRTDQSTPYASTVRRMLEPRSSTATVVGYSAKVDGLRLLRAGYPDSALVSFSPYTSGFAQVARIAWGAKQAFEMFWYVEDDVIIPCGIGPLIWHARIRTPRRTAGTPVHLTGRPALPGTAWATTAVRESDRLDPSWRPREQLVSIRCKVHHAKSWARPELCSYCAGLSEWAQHVQCTLGVAGLTRGLLLHVDALLRQNISAHHEIFTPEACLSMTAPRSDVFANSGHGSAAAPPALAPACRVVSLKGAEGSARVQGVFGVPTFLTDKDITALRAVRREAQHPFDRLRRCARARSRPSTNHSIIEVFHPVKCDGNVQLGSLPRLEVRPTSVMQPVWTRVQRSGAS